MIIHWHTTPTVRHRHDWLRHLSLTYAESVQSHGEPQELPHYQSALLLTPLSSKGEDSFTDIRLNDPVYSARTEGEPNSFSHRIFLQVSCSGSLLAGQYREYQVHSTHSSLLPLEPLTCGKRHTRYAQEVRVGHCCAAG